MNISKTNVREIEVERNNTTFPTLAKGIRLNNATKSADTKKINV
jgi:hypothetical protein